MIRKLLLLLLIPLLLGCGDKVKEKHDGPQNIVVTTGMLGDAVRHIGGDLFNVTALMGPGVDPHLYKASEGDVTLLDHADIIVYNGLHLEGKMGDIMGKMARIKPVIAAAELLPDERLNSPPEFKGQHDPHIWFDLSLWADMIELLTDELSQIDSSKAHIYRKNADAYVAQIRSLHNEIVEQISTIPGKRRVLITAHDAFGYFGKAYNIEVRGLQGISTVSEYGLLDVTQLVDFIVERGIKAVFVESSVPTKSIEAVQAGVNGQGKQVVIGGTLYSDAMGNAGTDEGTYLGMVRHNVSTIVRALK